LDLVFFAEDPTLNKIIQKSQYQGQKRTQFNLITSFALFKDDSEADSFVLS